MEDRPLNEQPEATLLSRRVQSLNLHWLPFSTLFQRHTQKVSSRVLSALSRNHQLLYSNRSRTTQGQLGRWSDRGHKFPMESDQVLVLELVLVE